MKKSRYTDQQIGQALRQAEQGTAVAELCRKLGVSETTFYHWKKRYAGMGVAELRRVKQLEDENRRLKQVVADLTLDKAMLQDVLQKKGLRPARRRDMAGYLVAAFQVPRRRACGVVQCNRATFYYRSQRRDVTPLRMRLRELAAARPRFGYRRLHILLRREGWAINHKKTYRLYRDEQLGLRVHRRRIRILTVEDVFTRECLAVEVDTSLVSARVVAVLTRLVQARGAPAVISVDNGSEFYSRTTDRWAYQVGVRLDFSRPGKPMDNPFIESFNGRLRDEHLNTELFFSVADAEDEEEKVTPNLLLRCRKKKSLFRRSSKRMWLYNGRRSRTKSGSLHPHPWALSSSSVLMRKVNTSPLRQRSPLGSPSP